jgi:hypothetical protein
MGSALPQGILSKNWLVLALALLGLAAALVVASQMPVDTAHPLLVEGGPVEVVTAVLLFAMAGVALVLWWHRGSVFGLLATVAFLMAAREFDLHTAFTTHGIFSTKEFFRPTVPAGEKLLAGAALLALLALVAISIRASWQELRRLWQARSPAVYGLATIVLLLPVLKLFDGLPRMMRGAGAPIGDAGMVCLLALEEVGELMLPVLLVVVMVQLWRQAPRTTSFRYGSAPLSVDGR